MSKLGSTFTPTRWRWRRTTWVAVSCAAALGVSVASLALIHREAHQQAESVYQLARDAHAVATAALFAAQSDLVRDRISGNDALAVAAEVIASTSDAVFASAARERLQSETDVLTEALETTTAEVPFVNLTEGSPPSGEYASAETSEGVDALTRETKKLQRSVRATRALERNLAATTRATEGAGSALLSSLGDVADHAISKHSSASNSSRRALIAEAKLAARLVGTWDARAAPVAARFSSALSALRASHLEGEGKKFGPLYEDRVQAESFARSIAGDVLIEFEWVPSINIDGTDWGTDGTLAGVTDYAAESGYHYSTMMLTDSVAASWNLGPQAEALVAHEVGHSLTGKCYAIFSASFGVDVEKWATAWAIGKGFTDGSNGEHKYGRPSDREIRLTEQCR